MAHVLERRRYSRPSPRDHSPAGFKHFFDELADLLSQLDFSPEQIGPLAERYGHYFDLERTAAVAEELGLHFSMPE